MVMHVELQVGAVVVVVVVEVQAGGNVLHFRHAAPAVAGGTAAASTVGPVEGRRQRRQCGGLLCTPDCRCRFHCSASRAKEHHLLWQNHTPLLGLRCAGLRCVGYKPRLRAERLLLLRQQPQQAQGVLLQGCGAAPEHHDTILQRGRGDSGRGATQAMVQPTARFREDNEGSSLV